MFQKRNRNLLWASVVGILMATLTVAVSIGFVSAQMKMKQPNIVKSKNSFEATVNKFKEAVIKEGLFVLLEADHQKMLSMVGKDIKGSISIHFAKPQMGAMLLEAEPKAAVEMPMRVAIRELDNGDIIVIYYSPSYLFSHYENEKLKMMGENMDKMIASFVEAATKSGY